MTDACCRRVEPQSPATVGAYLKRRRESAGLSIEDIATMFTLLSSARDWCAEQLRALEEAAAPPRNYQTWIHGLRGAFPFDLEIARQLAERDPANPDLPVPQLCRVCACSWTDPCVDDHGATCAWAEPDLCTTCAAARAEVPAA